MTFNGSLQVFEGFHLSSLFFPPKKFLLDEMHNCVQDKLQLII